MSFPSYDPSADGYVVTLVTTILAGISLIMYSTYLILLPPKAKYIDLNKVPAGHDDVGASLLGSHVVVTGGSSGIGLSVAKILASKPCIKTVTIMSRSKRKLEAAKKEIEAVKDLCSSVNTVALDLAVSDEEGFEVVEKAVSDTVARFGPPLMLFNCAGAARAKRFGDMDFDLFPRLASVNFFGTAAATRAFYPHMVKHGKGGRIVITSSAAGQIGLYGYTSYSASKFALRGFAESLAMEVSFASRQLSSNV